MNVKSENVCIPEIKEKDVSKQNDVKEFYANKKDHKVSSLKKLIDELDS